MVDVGVLRDFGEGRGRQLPASVAIDAGGVDEKLARDVFGYQFRAISHLSGMGRRKRLPHLAQALLCVAVKSGFRRDFFVTREER